MVSKFCVFLCFEMFFFKYYMVELCVFYIKDNDIFDLFIFYNLRKSFFVV